MEMVNFRQFVVNAGALIFLCLTSVFMIFLPSVTDAATTLYVSDTTLEANLRSGTSQANRIIGMLKPGTQVTIVLEEDGWAKVTLEDGRTGWILKRYLSERPPWRATAAKLSTENEQLRAQLNKIRSENRGLVQKNNDLQGQTKAQQEDLVTVHRDYEDLKNSSTNYLNLKMAYENLQNEARKTKAKLDELEKAYGKLKMSTSIRWFLSGAGVLFLGWIVGSSMARIRRRRSSDYYKF
jgi:SH3 domain protein